MDIALDVKGRGDYVNITRRITKQGKLTAKNVPVTYSPWYAFDPKDPRMLGYDYCTPDYVMGSLIIDPSLPQVNSNSYTKGQDLKEGYPNLTTQNRYHAIVFASDINARVLPQCEGLGNHKTYGQQQAVQHENLLLVQRHANARQSGDMRVIWGGKGMKDRLVIRNGWMILEEGDAWLGVKGFSRSKENTSCGSKWDNNVIQRMNDGNAPVAFVAGRKKHFADLKSFNAYLNSFVGKLDSGWFVLSEGTKRSLALHLTSSKVPKVNSEPVDLRPKMLFDSPFLKSIHGTGSVTIQKGNRELKIDMSKVK